MNLRIPAATTRPTYPIAKQPFIGIVTKPKRSPEHADKRAKERPVSMFDFEPHLENSLHEGLYRISECPATIFYIGED